MSRPSNAPPLVSPKEWETARQQLLEKEKASTRARDALAAAAAPHAVDEGREKLHRSTPPRARSACSTCSRGVANS